MIAACPVGVSADEILAEIRRLYQQFDAIGGMSTRDTHPETHAQQSVLIAQIRAWGVKYTALTTKSSCRAAERVDSLIDRISAESAAS